MAPLNPKPHDVGAKRNNNFTVLVSRKSHRIGFARGISWESLGGVEGFRV